MKEKGYLFWVNLITIVLGIGLVIFLLVRPKEKTPDPAPTEPETMESAETAPTETEPTAPEREENTTKPVPKQTDYPKIDEIAYYFTNATCDGQPVVLMGYQNNSRYTVTSVQLYFKLKADATQEERALFDTFVNSGNLVLDALSPSFFSEIVCDPGETGEGTPCTLFDQTYATDARQCQVLALHGATITFQGNDGRIYTVVYTAKNDTHVLQNNITAAQKWSTKNFTKVTPKPKTRFITVNINDNDYFRFTAYDMNYLQFQNYCSECYAAGFKNDVIIADSAFTGTNDRGLILNLQYNAEKQTVLGIAASKTAGKNEQDNTDAPTYSIAEVMSRYEPILDEPVSKYLEVDNSRTRIYQPMYLTYHIVVPVFTPALKPFSDDAIACLADMEKDLKAELEGIAYAATEKFEPMTIYITFDAYLNGDILSIVIRSESSYDSCAYYTYNFDITTGKRLHKTDLMEKLQITDLDERLLKTAKNGFETQYGPVGDSGNAGDFKQQQLNATMTPANLEKTQFFVGPDGKVMTVMNIYAMAGASSYYELVPLA